jgi:uncharacterized protein involved in exopolysaccharide biosynthesis
VSKWYLILLFAILFGVAGITYAWLQDPIYTAELTFAPETDKGSGLGAYAGLAAQFGIEMGGSIGGGAFEGDNLSEFLQSNMLIQSTLLKPIIINNNPQSLINYYIETKKFNKGWENDKNLNGFIFQT